MTEVFTKNEQNSPLAPLAHLWEWGWGRGRLYLFGANQTSPDKGAKLGFREATLHASVAGWLCKASRGGWEGLVFQ
jgi:hypothetical protein